VRTLAIHNPSGLAGEPWADNLRLSMPADPDQQIQATIGGMRAMVDDAVLNGQVVQRVAKSIAASAPQFDKAAQISALYNWLAAHVRFSRDTFPTEHLRHPEQLIEEIQADGAAGADCDDLAMLAAALLRSMGFNAIFVVAGRSELGRFEHVFPAFIDGTTIVPMDVQQREPVGTWPAVIRRVAYFRA
jgi:transglutaminase-like putative cysteine protease